MFTADNARQMNQDDLDERIEQAVKEYSGNYAYMRVYREDPWLDNLQEELEKRGFQNIDIPDICLKGDVYFTW